MFAILSQTPLRGDVDLSALRVLFSASVPLLAEDNRRLHLKTFCLSSRAPWSLDRS